MIPTRSQLQAWDTEHLVNAATYWTDTANRWEDTFTHIHNQSQTMGWEGQGGDALRTRTGGDLATVSAKADLLRNAAQAARTGASNISAAQRQALYAVADAQNAGFVVEEDLSVTDTHWYSDPAQQAARQAQADTLATDIYQRTAQLLNAETQASGQLTAATGEVGDMNFRGAGPDGFDLDTQYARPAGLIGGAPRGVTDSSVDCGAYLTGLTQITLTYLSLASQCCKD